MRSSAPAIASSRAIRGTPSPERARAWSAPRAPLEGERRWPHLARAPRSVRGTPAMTEPNINVEVDDENRQRILEEEERWDGKKLVILTVVSLVIVLATLYAMANFWYWDHRI